MSEPKLNIKEETSTKKTRSPPKKAKVEQSVPRKKKLKTDAEKTAEKAQHLRFGKAELTPDELSRLSKAQKREMYAAHAARSAVHREVDQYEDDNVGTQALSEGEKAAETTHDISKSRYARKLKKKAKMQGKKGARTAKSFPQEPTAAQDAGASCTGEGGSNWLSRWRQKQDIQKSYRAATRSGGTAAQTAGGQKAASGGVPAAKSGIKHIVTQASIDGKKVLVQADRAKTKSSLRTLPLVPPIRDRLLMLKGQQETYRRLCGKSYNRDYLGYLCVDEIGNIIRPNYVSEQFPKLLEKNGLRPIRFHDLRHSCASLLLANGVPMKQIQEWLGHSDFSTTANIYAHLDYASKLSSAQAMLEGLGYGNASA